MSECKPDASSPDNVDTLLNMPRGPERDEALRKAQQLRYAAEALQLSLLQGTQTAPIGVWNHEFPKFTFVHLAGTKFQTSAFCAGR